MEVNVYIENIDHFHPGYLMTKFNVFKILLADDDEDDCLLFCEALEELSQPTQIALVHNGEQLLRYLRANEENPPHILFLDLNMPRINGLQCLKAIKEMSNLRQIRLVIFSTSYHPEIAEQLYENGAIHYIQKPGDFKHLKLLIAKVIELNQEELGTGHGRIKKNRKRNYIVSVPEN